MEGNYDIQLGNDRVYNTLDGGFFIAPSNVQQVIVHNTDQKSGNMHYHEVFSEEIATERLAALPFGNKVKETVARLCRAHMFDLNGTARQITRRKFILRNQDIFEELRFNFQGDEGSAFVNSARYYLEL